MYIVCHHNDNMSKDMAATLCHYVINNCLCHGFISLYVKQIERESSFFDSFAENVDKIFTSRKLITRY